MKKFLFRALMASLVFILALILFLRFWNFGIPEQDFSDMMPTRRNIPQETNAFYVYREAYSKITDVDRLKELAEQENPDDNEVEEFLKENAEALALIDKGLEMDFEEPDVTGFDDLLPFLKESQAISNLLTLRVNDFNYEAVTTFLKQNYKAPECLITFLVTLSNHKKLVSKQLILNSTVGQGVIPVDVQESMKFSFKAEFQVSLSPIDMFSKGEFKLDHRSGEKRKNVLPGNYMWQPNRTKEITYLNMKQHFFNVDRLYKDFDSSFSENFEQEMNDVDKTHWLKGNQVGVLLLAMITPALDKSLRKVKELEVAQKALIIKSALLQYQSKNKKMASSLEDLVPEFLSEIPKDPFDGESLRFLPSHKYIYSVGKNLTDDNGKKCSDWQNAFMDDGEGDIVIDLHLPVVKE